MFTSGNFEPDYTVKHRYLIKHQGVWKFLSTWAVSPSWDDEVTDVIWLNNKQTMIASWWYMKNGRRFIKRKTPMVTDEELTFILLQVQDVNV